MAELLKGKFFVWDRATSRGDVSVVMEDESGQKSLTRINLSASASFVSDEDGNKSASIDLNILEASAFMGVSSAMIYDISSIFMETDSRVAENLAQLADKHPDVDSFLVLKKGRDYSISTVPDRFIQYSDLVRLRDEEEASAKGEEIPEEEATDSAAPSAHIDAKEDLKAYETPSNVTSFLLKEVDRQQFFKLAGMSVHKTLSASIRRWLALNGHSDIPLITDGLIKYFTHNTIQDSVGIETIKRYISYEEEAVIQQFDTLIDEIESTIGKDGEYGSESPLSVLSLLRETYEFAMAENHGMMETVTSEAFWPRWKKEYAPPIKRATPMPVFDPHAGSGAGMIKSFDNVGFNGILQGLDLREVKSDDERVDVLGGINITNHYDSLSNALRHNKSKKAAAHLLTYMNPPYTSDDSIARDTFIAFPDRAFIMGLFPEKMKAFLKHNISSDSILVSITREMTGYTDPKTPERFLLLMGKRLDKKARIESGDISKMSNLGNAIEASADTIADLEKVFGKYFSKYPSVGRELLESYIYFADSERRPLIFRDVLFKEVKENQEFIENSALLTESLKDTASTIETVLSPVAFAKRGKVFPDNRFYSKEGLLEKLSFRDVMANIPLLTHYRDKYPKIFSLVQEVAKDMGVPVSISETPKPSFILGERYQGKKEIVTSKRLGMMSLVYNPTSFDISKPEQKKMLRSLLEKNIYHGDMKKEDRIILDFCIENATFLLTKSKNSILDNTIMKDEIFVFVDKFGSDIGQLDVEIDDLYEALQSTGLFSIDDYIELAELSTDKKRKLMSSFVLDVGESVGIMANKIGEAPENLAKDIHARGMDIFGRLNKGEVSKKETYPEIFTFAEEKHFKRAFLSLYKDESAILRRTIDNVTTSAFYAQLSKEDIGTVSSFLKEVILEDVVEFFYDMDHIFEDLRDELSLKYYGHDKEKLAEDMGKFIDGIKEAVIPVYHIHKSATTAYTRYASMLLHYYTPIKHFIDQEEYRNDDLFVEKMYDKMFRGLFLNTMGLMPHQFYEAERFAEIAEKEKFKQLYIEARGGKTRTFEATGYFLSLLYNKPFSIILQTSNMSDISNQLLESFPQLALKAKYIVGSDKIDKNPENVFDMIPSDDMLPNPFRIAKQTNFVGGGATAAEETDEFSFRYEKTRAAVDELYPDDDVDILKDLAEKYPDSPFLSLLTEGCGG